MGSPPKFSAESRRLSEHRQNFAELNESEAHKLSQSFVLGQILIVIIVLIVIVITVLVVVIVIILIMIVALFFEGLGGFTSSGGAHFWCKAGSAVSV